MIRFLNHVRPPLSTSVSAYVYKETLLILQVIATLALSIPASVSFYVNLVTHCHILITKNSPQREYSKVVLINSMKMLLLDLVTLIQ